MAVNQMPYIGMRISLTSKALIRYEGTLYTIDAKESTVALSKVRSFGTEDRPAEKPSAPRNEIYEFIIFRAADIHEITVCGDPTIPGMPPSDPAIVLHSEPHQNTASAFGPIGNSGLPPPQPSFPQHNLMSSHFYEEKHELGPVGAPLPVGSGQQPRPISKPSNSISQALLQGQLNSNEQFDSMSHATDNHKPLPPQPLINLSPEVPTEPSFQQHNVIPKPTAQRPPPALSNDSSQGAPEVRRESLLDRPHPRPPQLRDRDHNNQTRHYVNRGGNVHRGYRGGSGQYHNNYNNYRTGQPALGRRNQEHGGRGGSRGGRPHNLRFAQDFDFELANNEFQKMKISTGSDGVISGTNSDAEATGEVEDKVIDGAHNDVSGDGLENHTAEQAKAYYDKKKSFFDKISCEIQERTEGRQQRPDWQEERKRNAETFGMTNPRRGGYGNNRGGGGYNNHSYSSRNYHRGGSHVGWGNRNGGFRQYGNSNRHYSSPRMTPGGVGGGSKPHPRESD